MPARSAAERNISVKGVVIQHSLFSQIFSIPGSEVYCSHL